MAAIRLPLWRCCFRPILRDVIPGQARTVAVQHARSSARNFTSTRTLPAAASQTASTREQLPEDENAFTRLAPASPSYFTGSADFFDNWLALQELYRKYQTLPVLTAEETARVKWKTLNQYRGIVGTEVKAARYKKILTLLNRLHRIEPALLPEDVKVILEMYKREMDPNVGKPKEKHIDKYGRALATGRRKTSTARVWLVEGDGEALINGKPLAQAFSRIVDRESVIWPLHVTDRVGKYNIWGLVSGGGTTGQAEALTLGVARALMIHEPLLKPALRRGNFPIFGYREPSNVTNIAQPAL